MKFFIFTSAIAMSLAASATQYSKLAVITAAKSRGCWNGIKAFISDHDLKDEWDSCQYLSDAYPAFATVTNALVETGLATAEDVAFVLSQSKDTALEDDLLTRLYAREVSTSTGRSRWHGRKVREVVNTNTLTKVSYYEDGTTFTDEAKITRSSDTSSVQAANAKLPRPVMTNGIPARLAAARLRQSENETTVSNVTVNITAGGN